MCALFQRSQNMPLHSLLKYAGFFLIIFTISGCGTSSIYQSNYPLTSKIVFSSQSDFKIQVPNNWRVINNNTGSFTDIFLVDNEYDNCIIFTPIHIEKIQDKSRIDSELDFVTIQFISLTKSKHKNKFLIITKSKSQTGTFPCNEMIYLLDDSRLCRTVIFKLGGKYIVCTAETKSHLQNSTADKTKLFTIQNSVIASIKSNS